MPATVPMTPAMATATHRDLEGHRQALQDEQELIAPELIGPQQVMQRGRLQSGERVLRRRPAEAPHDRPHDDNPD